MSNPKCLTSTDTKMLDKSLKTLDVLQNCSLIINVSCSINNTILNDTNRVLFDDCFATKEVMADKIGGRDLTQIGVSFIFLF